MKTKNKVNINRIMMAIAHGVGEKAGCNDEDDSLAAHFIELASSNDPKNHEKLYDEIVDRVGY